MYNVYYIVMSVGFFVCDQVTVIPLVSFSIRLLPSFGYDKHVR